MNTFDKTAASPERRRFLKQTAGAGMAFGVGPLLIGCGSSSDGAAAAGTQARTYLFDLSNADPQADYFLVAGSRHHPLSRATPEQIARARAANPDLQGRRDQSLTHIGEDLPLATSLQVCYVKGVPRGASRIDGEWTMHTVFYHVPAGCAALANQAAMQSCAGTSAVGGADIPPGCIPPDEESFKDYFTHAMALICNHPEVGSFDGPTLAYVQQHIICGDINLENLAASLYQQGPATTTGGWATLVEVIDPVTHLPRLSSKGDKLYFAQHSPDTLRLTGLAIQSVLPKVKNDPKLGANITGLKGSDFNTALQGKMWVTRDGTPTRLPRAPQAGAGGDVATWTQRDVSSGHGCSITLLGGGADRVVTFNVSNWYLRYLGLYIRFFDAGGNPIALSQLDAKTREQFDIDLSGAHDGFLALVNQELVILGIPVKQASQSYSVTVPAKAASFQILAGGIGSGTNSYPDTIKPGAVMTVVLDLAMPGLFLLMAAVPAYSVFVSALSTATTLLLGTAKAMALAITDAALAGTYQDPKVFLNLVTPLVPTLYTTAVKFYVAMVAAIGAGEAEGAVDDAIPMGVGLIIQAVIAAGTLDSIEQTSVEIATSPWTFVAQIDATHQLTVTLNHDPADPQGFPESATHYRLTAVCDSASPADSGPIAMPGGTRTAPLTYTFDSLPAGGLVTVTVGFYSADGWLAGHGSTGAIDNTLDTAAITIKESLVPLTASTVYSHKQKLGLDGSGRHVWIATPQPPAGSIGCNNQPGNLCKLAGITISEAFGAVGYSWQSFSSSMQSYANGANGQMYQFANISVTDNPQSGYVNSGGGFPAPPRLSYSRAGPGSENFYVDTSSDPPYVRRIQMTGVGQPPAIDKPGLKRSVGRFNFLPDAFLIHPTGKLIGINSAYSKLEVLVPSATPVAEGDAPLAQAFSGPGSRDGLMNGPVSAVVAPGGAILVLEQQNNRVQAFDTGANPVKFFGGSSTMALKAQSGNVIYLDMAIEFAGYIYVLSMIAGTSTYVMDIYTPAGALLATTSGMNASKLAVDLFRNVFTLNFESIQPPGLTEPSVSQWIPSTP